MNTDNFINETKIVDVNGEKKGVIQIYEYLCKPETVYKLMISSDMGCPAISGIVKELEEKFNESAWFPVTTIGNNKNYVARQNVGRMIKKIMRNYGYLPIESGLSERARIPNTIGAKYFSTGTIYKKECNAKFKINVTSEKI